MEKLYTCNKPGCNFKAKHKVKEGAEYLTEYEYKQIFKDGKLVCPENPNNTTCQMRELEPHEYPKPKKEPLNTKLIAAIAAGVLLIGGLVFFFIGGSSDKPQTDEVAKVDTAAVAPPVAEEPATPEEPAAPEVKENPEPVNEAPAKTATNTSSDPKVAGGSAPKGTQSLTVGGNSYKGEVLNGKPHGMGTMYYKKSTQISPKDLKKRMAEEGDYLTGEFFEGNVVQGKLFDADNNVKEVIMIGR